jgi:cytochrome P450
MAESDAELLLDPAVQADPFGYYEQLRAEQPVLRMPGTGFYVLTRYEDLRTILRDPETFSNTLDLEELSGERAKTSAPCSRSASPKKAGRTSRPCTSPTRPNTPATAAS